MHRRLTHAFYVPLPEDPPAGDPTSGGAPNGGVPGKTFTQDELNAQIAERLARERAKFSDYNDIKAKAAKLEQIEAANATEQEKAVKAAREEGRAEAQQAANARIVASEARALAAAAKFRDPGDAVRFLDLSAVKVTDDGDVDQSALKSLLDDLAKEKDYLLVKDEAPKPPPSFGGGPRQTHDPKGDSPRAQDLAQIEADLQAAGKSRG